MSSIRGTLQDTDGAIIYHAFATKTTHGTFVPRETFIGLKADGSIFVSFNAAQRMRVKKCATFDQTNRVGRQAELSFSSQGDAHIPVRHGERSIIFFGKMIAPESLLGYLVS